MVAWLGLSPSFSCVLHALKASTSLCHSVWRDPISSCLWYYCKGTFHSHFQSSTLADRHLLSESAVSHASPTCRLMATSIPSPALGLNLASSETHFALDRLTVVWIQTGTLNALHTHAGCAHSMHLSCDCHMAHTPTVRPCSTPKP